MDITEGMNLNVYESQGGRTFEYLDDWGNIYARATREDVKNITGQGISISQPRYRVPGQPPLRRADPIYPPTTSTLPRHVGFEDPPSLYDPMRGTSSMDNLGGSLSRLNLGDAARDTPRGPIPSHVSTGFGHYPPLGPHGSYGVTMAETGVMSFSQGGPRPLGGAGIPISGDPTPRMGESMPAYSVPGLRPEVIVPRAPRPRRNDRRKVRPSQLQKICKAFDGSGDPYDHVARFRQVLYAEDVEDGHTMVQGFGLTLEGRALRWFQSLNNATLYDFEILVEAFIKENTKKGIKHNTLTQILDFKQKEKESVKDAIARLRSLISRCPRRDMPAEDRLISCFFESFKDKNLHMQLFGKIHLTR